MSGGFLFDDFPNLEQLGARGPIRSFELLRIYLSSGFAGPTGRPLALLSFLLDANNWPTDPWPFKRTNLIIHLLTGVVLFATTRKLLEAFGRAPRDAAWIGALTATLWLVNPFLVSTTLYAVQRMTQLAALFALAGIWSYLHGRALLASKPKQGYAWLCLGLPLFTLLAVLSKENGALAPMLVLVIHWLLQIRNATPGPPRLWAAVFLGLPSALVVAYLAMRIPGAERSFAARDFTLGERLLSQARFLWDYLYHLAIPHIQTQGLYQDGRAVSRSLLEPWTTLPALVGLAGLIGAAWLARVRWPLFSLAVLFFLAGHLLESTTVPLELYFEHRNYLPAAFLFLPLASWAHDSVVERARPAAVIALLGILVAGYAWATAERAALWGSRDQLLLVWAETNPGSDRAQVSAAQVWLRLDQPEQALSVLDAAGERMPDSSLLIVNRIAFRAALGRLSIEELEEGARRLRAARFDAQGLTSLEHLVAALNENAPLPEHAAVVLRLLEGIREDLGRRVPVAHRMTLYLQGLLLAGQGQPEAAMPYLIDALERLNSVDSGLRMVSDLATLGHYEQALDLLERAETLLALPGRVNEGFSDATYRTEIERLRAVLLDDLRRTRASAEGRPEAP